ncbi:MAG: hypothetical protein ACREEV_11590, partial [Dongiaceae bacterium]
MPESLAPLTSARAAAPAPVRLRDAPTDTDRRAVRELAASTGFFSDEEIAVAVELVEARLGQG